jgi:hypothetical protein
MSTTEDDDEGTDAWAILAFGIALFLLLAGIRVMLWGFR